MGGAPGPPGGHSVHLRFSARLVRIDHCKANPMNRLQSSAIALTMFLGNRVFAQQGGGDGFWVRNAVAVEAVTFDECNAHQPPMAGDYHYHANPSCLRYQLGDNLVRAAGRYRESAGPWKHSPILGWANDGYPIYGPYGYSDPKNPQSAVRRMRSSFKLRNITVRHTYADWAAAQHGIPAQLTPAQYGPDVSAKFPLGWYAEDFDFVEASGDLDLYNGRTAITPEYPIGTYAYYITVNDDGSPAYPYALGRQYNGTIAGGGRINAVPGTAADYFNQVALNGQVSTDPRLNSWDLRYANQYVQIVDGQNLAAGPVTTWTGQSTPVYAGVQRIRYSDTTIYINSTGLPSHLMGPWYNPQAADGIFENYPKDQNIITAIPRSPAPMAKKSTTDGPIARLVNGAPLNTILDGASWSYSLQADSQVPANAAGPPGGGPPGGPPAGGGGAQMNPAGLDISLGNFVVASAATSHLSALTPESIATAWAAGLVTTASTTTSETWSDNLGGVTVTVKDASGTSRNAKLQYVGPTQVNFLVPAGTAKGTATISISAGAVTRTSTSTITDVAPRFFTLNDSGLVAANLIRVRQGVQTVENVTQPVEFGPAGDQLYLAMYGTGLRTRSSLSAVTVTVGGVNAPVFYAGPQGQTPGLDQLDVLLPRELSGAGLVDIVVFADQRRSTTVNLVVK